MTTAHPAGDGAIRTPRLGRGARTLSRQRVVATAVAVIDTGGLQAFTLTAVAERLQVQTMALYRYVPSREDLLNLVVEAVLAEVHNADADNAADGDGAVKGQVDSGRGDCWQDFLARSAREVRRVALAHPQVFPLVATRPPEAPWVRPPLRSLPWMENFVHTLAGFGFSPALLVITYRAYASFLLGHLLLEVMALGVDVAPVTADDHGRPDGGGGAVLANYPVLASMDQEMRRDLATEVFEAALADLTGRLAVKHVPPERPPHARRTPVHRK